MFQPVCYIATLCNTKAVDKRVDLIRVLLTLAGGEGKVTMFFSDGSLQGCFAQVGAADSAELQATAYFPAYRRTLNGHHYVGA